MTAAPPTVVKFPRVPRNKGIRGEAQLAAAWFRAYHLARARALPPDQRLAEYKAAAVFASHVYRVTAE